jgi:hypothetical protein
MGVESKTCKYDISYSKTRREQVNVLGGWVLAYIAAARSSSPASQEEILLVQRRPSSLTSTRPKLHWLSQVDAPLRCTWCEEGRIDTAHPRQRHVYRVHPSVLSSSTAPGVDHPRKTKSLDSRLRQTKAKLRKSNIQSQVLYPST